MARSNEPAVWAVFSAGGVITAFLLPGLALVISGWFGAPVLGDYELMGKVFANPFVGAAIVIFLFVALVHAFHRIRFVIYDFGWFHNAMQPIALLCYGLALIGTGWGAYLLFFTGAST